MVNSWWPEAGDTHELLGAREWLERNWGQLSAQQEHELGVVDARVEALALTHASASGWDVEMLRKTSKIASHHYSAA